VFREHWREGDFWRWWWADRVPLTAKTAVWVLLVGGLLGGGWLAANRVNPATPSDSAGGFVVQTTVKRVVTAHEHGKVVQKVIPTVKRLFLRTQTRFVTQTTYDRRSIDARLTVTAPGAVRVVRRPIVRYVHEVTTAPGKTTTAVETKVVPKVERSVQTVVATHEQTVLQPVTQVRTETQTVSQTATQTLTQTVPQVVTRTVTDVQTTTVGTTVLLTAPVVTVTVKKP
jgi:hypothetical protein